jgi:cytochrome b pre-mRNA-processing protein 3
MILSVFTRRQHRNIAALYGAIVAQARDPAFYGRFGVPDTVDGRFELIVLHLVLVLRRLGQDAVREEAGAAVAVNGPGRGLGHEAGQQLFDAFCRDLDDNLREMGVGDMAVPRRMRRFGEAFYGRQAAYDAALAQAGEEPLEKALARNIFGLAAADGRAAQLARYTRAAADRLSTQAEDTLVAGKRAAGDAVFPSPEAFVDA